MIVVLPRQLYDVAQSVHYARDVTMDKPASRYRRVDSI